MLDVLRRPSDLEAGGQLGPRRPVLRVGRARLNDQLSRGRPIAIGIDRVVQFYALEGKAPEYLANLGHIIDGKHKAAFQLRQPVSNLCKNALGKTEP